MTFDDFKALARRTLRDPEGAARWLIDQRWPMQVRWMALVLAVSLSGLLAYGSTHWSLVEARDHLRRRLGVPAAGAGGGPAAVALPAAALLGEG